MKSSFSGEPESRGGCDCCRRELAAVGECLVAWLAIGSCPVCHPSNSLIGSWNDLGRLVDGRAAINIRESDVVVCCVDGDRFSVLGKGASRLFVPNTVYFTIFEFWPFWVREALLGATGPPLSSQP
jgi:hypothetical protein